MLHIMYSSYYNYYTLASTQPHPCTRNLYTMSTTLILFFIMVSDLNSHHFKVVTYLHDLDRQQIRDLGGALGLTYSNLEKMSVFPADMVAAWLRREDNIVGEPTWRSLVQALKRVGQGGVAYKIETERCATMPLDNDIGIKFGQST